MHHLKRQHVHNYGQIRTQDCVTPWDTLPLLFNCFLYLLHELFIVPVSLILSSNFQKLPSLLPYPRMKILRFVIFIVCQFKIPIVLFYKIAYHQASSLARSNGLFCNVFLVETTSIFKIQVLYICKMIEGEQVQGDIYLAGNLIQALEPE